MDWLTFLAILIIILPFHLMIWNSAKWFRAKFDKYETIAISYIQSGSTKDIDSIRKLYADYRNELGDTYPELDLDATSDEVIAAFKKIHKHVVSIRRSYILDGTIRAIASTLKDRHRGVETFVDGINNTSGRFGMTVDATKYADMFDDNPFISAGIDLIAGAWNRT